MEAISPTPNDCDVVTEINKDKIFNLNKEKSITIAIESGSKHLRDVINKKLSDEEIFAAAKYAKEGGLKHLKLYGMVGLPTEKKE